MIPERLAKKIMHEKHESNYIHPSVRDNSYILLVLSIGAVKRDTPELNYLGNLPEKEEEEMIDAGVKIIDGSMTSEAYYTKFKNIINKVMKKEIVLSDIAKAGVISRLELSKMGTKQATTLDKNTKKEIKESIQPIKNKTYQISPQGRGDMKVYRIETIDGTHMIDMFFDSPEEAKQFAQKKNISLRESILKESETKKVELITNLYYVSGREMQKDDNVSENIADQFDDYGLYTPEELKDKRIDSAAKKHIMLYAKKGLKGTIDNEDYFISDDRNVETSLKPEWYKLN